METTLKIQLTRDTGQIFLVAAIIRSISDHRLSDITRSDEATDRWW
jgi:hypothetical protein